MKIRTYFPPDNENPLFFRFIFKTSVPAKQFLMFPDDPEKGRLLRPDLELTLDRLKSYDFDPNAEVLLALETLLGIETDL
jgi:hypothetical protein